MVVLVVFLIVWKPARHAGGPNDQKLTFYIIIEQLRCPGVDSGCVHPCGDEALGRPVYQILRRAVAEALVSPPAAGPDEMEGAVRSFYNRRIAHHLLHTHLRTEEHPLDGVPPDAVVAIDEPQPFCSGLMEGGGHIDVLSLQQGRAPQKDVC